MTNWRPRGQRDDPAAVTWSSADLSEPLTLYERRGHVAVVTMNRPHALNAINAALAEAIGARLAVADADPDVRVIVLTGAGRAFCAGADLKEIAAGRPVDPAEHPECGFGGVTRHWLDTPLIAAVNGYALAGGTEITLACDLVVAAQDVRFGLPEVKRGLLAAAGGVIRLQRQIPMKRALELALTGDPITASSGAALGLVNVVTPPGDALSEALKLADRVAVNAPLSLRATKRALYEAASGSDWNPDWTGDGWVVINRLRDEVFASEDAIEGAAAFVEKRDPLWRGR